MRTIVGVILAMVFASQCWSITSTRQDEVNSPDNNRASSSPYVDSEKAVLRRGIALGGTHLYQSAKELHTAEGDLEALPTYKPLGATHYVWFDGFTLSSEGDWIDTGQGVKCYGKAVVMVDGDNGEFSSTCYLYGWNGPTAPDRWVHGVQIGTAIIGDQMIFLEGLPRFVKLRIQESRATVYGGIRMTE